MFAAVNEVATDLSKPANDKSSARSKSAPSGERVGRNPKTGVEAPITPRKVLTFKASPVLVARVNGEAINDEAE